MELIPLFQTPCARSLLKILQNTLNRQSIHPPPAFGSSPNLEALALEANKSKDQDGDSSLLDSSHLSRPMHEVTFSAEDKPKLLSQVYDREQYSKFDCGMFMYSIYLQ
ncbi:hypothetical protein ES332_D13G090400v1 [Gossypium tomentosum]|uniref:Uncharacterized protein n=1 Tax=Gossypium tomentosum TaxID=34277 RepID=A0A5D2HUI7_GOSTO|nr:hypothetical protein ES332_D13G090400v1 [Gossypium tomentosum]